MLIKAHELGVHIPSTAIYSSVKYFHKFQISYDEKKVVAMELKENKIEFDLGELVSLLISDKTEGYRLMREKIIVRVTKNDCSRRR